jgi:hypothetical protein
MNNYLLDNYSLSKCEILQSLFVSEYGLRHWAHSKKQTPYKWGHRIIALTELCPLIGLIATIIEKLVVSCIRHNKLEPSPPTKPSLTKKRKWLFRGTQTGSNGPVSITKVESIRAKLDAHRPIGIQFNQKKVAPSIEGGTCTAMSLEFLDSYFKTKKISIKQLDAQSDRLVDHLIKLGHNFASSSQEMRDRQAAYNTIEVQLSGDDIDYSKNKVQSLANYHSLIIDYSSPEIDVDKLDDESAISKEIDALPEGVFLVRILKPTNNEKLEEHGHSLVYIKERGLGLFYDPNYGVRNLSITEHSKVLFKIFKNCFQLFEIHKARFYKLQPK